MKLDQLAFNVEWRGDTRYTMTCESPSCGKTAKAKVAHWQEWPFSQTHGYVLLAEIPPGWMMTQPLDHDEDAPFFCSVECFKKEIERREKRK